MKTLRPRLAFVLLLAVLPACGCLGRIYTKADKSMVSGARDSNRRADAKLEAGDIAGARNEIRIGDRMLGVMDDRHGRSRRVWPAGDSANHDMKLEAVGAYKQGTYWGALLERAMSWKTLLMLIGGGAGGGLGGLLFLLAQQWMKRRETERAALRTVDKLKGAANGAFTGEDGELTPAFREATAGLKEVHKRHRG